MRGEATPAVPPGRAERWLREWAAIGGGVTIDAAGNVCPWLMNHGKPALILIECDCTCADACPQGRAGIEAKCLIWKQAAPGDDSATQTRLLRELDEEEGLRAGVRVLASTGAMRLASRALKAMGRTDDAR